MERLKEIEARKAEIKELLQSDAEVDLNALETELNSLDEEIRSINEQQVEEQKKAEVEAEERARELEIKTAEKEAEERRAIAEKIDERKITAVNIVSSKEESKTMTETRNTKEYIDAFAEYLKTGKETRCREIMSRSQDVTKVTSELDTAPNGTGTVAVPDFVWDIVKTNWEKNELLRYCRRVSIPGTLKVNFELNSDGAQIHAEGDQSVTRETLIHGIVHLPLMSIKKIVAISDEVYDLRGEEFVRYIYDEITQKIYKLLADEIVAEVSSMSTSATASYPAAAQVTASVLSLGLVAEAVGQLSDEASNPIIVMNKGTWASFKALQYAANYPVDAFEGLTVVFNSTLPTFAAASSASTFMIVGDFNEGLLINEVTRDVQFKFDDLTRKDEDMIEIMGRKFVGYAPIAMNAFTNIVKGAGGAEA